VAGRVAARGHALDVAPPKTLATNRPKRLLA
jgi:hypothetical protein